jgi:NAD(P)-dependent dehydrogenase (short-subunit alcohol dehydrogenase family)
MAFNGQVAFITGGASGMGRLAARSLAKEGKSVAAVDINAGGLAETAAGHSSIRTYTLDVTNAAAVESVVKQAESDLGPIDRVYNAAAIMPLGLLLEQELDTIHRIMAINYSGLVNVTRFTLPGMLDRGRGDFINFASLAGWVPTIYVGAYNASKFAVVAFSEVLHQENRDRGVRFACVCPPPVKTPLLNWARDTVWPRLFDQVPAIQPEEVLAAIEKTLENDRFWVFPGRGTKAGWRMRRWFPSLVWRNIRKIEGI